MNTHTPGPWEIRTGSRGQKSIVGAYHIPTGAPAWVGGHLLVCDLSGDEHYDEGNARLLAAAPELLASCQWLIQFAEFFAEKHNDGVTMAACIGQARAAIAKAKGTA